MDDITREDWSMAVEYMFKLVPSARQESVWLEVFTAAVSYLNRFIVGQDNKHGNFVYFLI